MVADMKAQRLMRKGQRALRVSAIAFALLAGTSAANGQWIKYPVPGTPRTADGKPNLSAPAPRAANGKPDLSGIWQVEPSPIPELMKLLAASGGENGLGEALPSKYFINLFSDVKPEETFLRASDAAAYRQSVESFGAGSPGVRCLPAGVPMGDLIPEPFKIIQTPVVTAILQEGNTTFRQIHTDGRTHPRDPQPTWLGYSVGKWEGDSLVVDTIGFNDRSWLDALGHVHSEALHVVERFTRRSFGVIELRLTVEDPKTYLKPVTVTVNLRLHPDTELLENFCENERDAHRLTRK
jgi:hypothetical protein